MMRRLLVLLSLLVLAAVQPAHSAPLKLGVLPAADTIVLHVAADEGLFAKQGLEVELVPFQSALELGAAMRAGALSGHFGDIINVLMQNESGSPQAIVATTSHSSPDNRCFGLVVSPKSKAQTLADLKGKDIAVSSATIIDFLLAQLLQQEGAAPDFLNRQDIRQIPVRLQMLLSGQIESALLPEPLVSLVEAKGARTILNDCKLNTPLAVIALKRDVLDAPDGAQTVAKFREALREAAKRINETPDAYRPIMEAKGLLPKGASANYTIVYVPDADCSGKMKISRLGGREENFAEWSEVYSEKGGKYNMTIFYSCDKNRKLEVSVNGTETVLKDLNSNKEVKSITIPVTLQKGYNTVRMGNDFGWAPDIDRFTLSRQ